MTLILCPPELSADAARARALASDLRRAESRTKAGDVGPTARWLIGRASEVDAFVMDILLDIRRGRLHIVDAQRVVREYLGRVASAFHEQVRDGTDPTRSADPQTLILISRERELRDGAPQAT